MFQFIGIMGAVLVIISFFLTWGTQTITFLGEEFNYTGMDFFNKEMWMEGTNNYDSWQNLIPLIALVLAVVALIISIVPGESLGGEKTEKMIGVVAIVISIVLLVMTVLFMTWFGGIEMFLMENSLGIGAYLCLIGSILVFVVGIMPLLKKTMA